MLIILVADHFGPCCVAAEDGSELYTLIRESLDRQESVTLDFTGVTTLTSLFLNNAIGRLHANFDERFLNAKLSSIGLDPADEAVLGIVQRNAVRFYGTQGEQREALISAACRSAEE